MFVFASHTRIICPNISTCDGPCKYLISPQIFFFCTNLFCTFLISLRKTYLSVQIFSLYKDLISSHITYSKYLLHNSPCTYLISLHKSFLPGQIKSLCTDLIFLKQLFSLHKYCLFAKILSPAHILSLKLIYLALLTNVPSLHKSYLSARSLSLIDTSQCPSHT
jgi:hypothetical protein